MVFAACVAFAVWKDYHFVFAGMGVAAFMLVRMGQKWEDSHRAAKRIDYDLMHPEKWTAGMQPPHAFFWLISQSPIGCRLITEFKY
jgi:hypothetical protein